MSNHWFGEELMNIFSERLKGILDSRGISQVWVAEKANATAATISRYMTTERVPRGDIVANISKALDVSADYLLGITDIQTPISKGRDQEYSPEVRLLCTCFLKASASDQKVIWTLMDKYMTPEEKGFLQKLLEYSEADAG